MITKLMHWNKANTMNDNYKLIYILLAIPTEIYKEYILRLCVTYK